MAIEKIRKITKEIGDLRFERMYVDGLREVSSRRNTRISDGDSAGRMVQPDGRFTTKYRDARAYVPLINFAPPHVKWRPSTKPPAGRVSCSKKHGSCWSRWRKWPIAKTESCMIRFLEIDYSYWIKFTLFSCSQFACDSHRALPIALLL